MTRSPKAFQSVVAVLAVWIVGRSLTMALTAVEAEVPRSSAPERSAAEDPTEALLTTTSSPAADAQPNETTALSVPRALPVQPSKAGPEVPKGYDADKLRRPSIASSEGAAQAGVASVSPGFGVGPVSSSPASAGDRFSLTHGWSASGWTLYRPGSRSASGLATNGQLGGSQTGVRVRKIVVDLGANISLGGSLRASSSFGRDAQREVAVGGSLRMERRMPVEIIAERRIALDGGARDRFVLLAASGIDDVKLPAKGLLSGYVQVGVAGVKSRDGFVDGAVRVERRLTEGQGYEVRAGANLSGAAQPGLSRVDVGPSVMLKLQSPAPPVRVSAEWRQRVAGNASPASGPAITVGVDF